MLKLERHEKIMRLLLERGSLLVSDACELLSCSDQTIRRDFQELEEQGRLKRIHGGAFIPSADDKGVPVQIRKTLIVEEKRHIANIAASKFINPGDVLMLDSSTTCSTLARHLLASNIPITIISNSLEIVHDFAAMQNSAHLICIGGRYAKRSGSFIGSEAVSGISNHVADKAFISCNAVDMNHGLLDNYENQKDVRLAMLEHSRKQYLLVDHTKFNDEADFIISGFSKINGIVTDKEPDAAWMDFFRKQEIEVIW